MAYETGNSPYTNNDCHNHHENKGYNREPTVVPSYSNCYQNNGNNQTHNRCNRNSNRDVEGTRCGTFNNLVSGLILIDRPHNKRGDPSKQNGYMRERCLALRIRRLSRHRLRHTLCGLLAILIGVKVLLAHDSVLSFEVYQCDV